MKQDKLDIARFIDHTYLKTPGERAAVRRLCREATKYGFASVCVHPCHIALAKKLLAKTPVKVCTVIDFPLGASTWLSKSLQAAAAIYEGADELDYVV